MPSLQVRDLPAHIYEKLLADARKQHRSLAQQAIYTLSKGLETDLDPMARRKRLLARIRSAGESEGLHDLKRPVDLVREDRDR